jgi:hypothetical protein
LVVDVAFFTGNVAHAFREAIVWDLRLLKT